MEIKAICEDTIRSIVPEYVRVFNGAPWNDKWTEASAQMSLMELVHTPNFYGWVALEDGQCRGAILGHVHHFSDQKTYYMDELFVSHNARRSGVASALYAALTEKMHEIGCTGVFLTTLRGSDAYDFYKSRGLIDLKDSAVMVGSL